MNKRVQKCLKLSSPLAALLAEESGRTHRAEVKIVERALTQFFAQPPDERERFSGFSGGGTPAAPAAGGGA